MALPSSPHPLHLYNSMTGGVERFVPAAGRRVKIFTCGPSIYDAPHLGNYRTFVFEDVLHRYLEYLGYTVERLLNFTDVEDKAIVRANELGVSLRQLTDQAASRFFADCGLLHVKLPDLIPRSSTSVDQAVNLITTLLDQGYAYRHREDIFFDPLKFEGFGRLFGLDLSTWPKRKIRFRQDTYTGRRWNKGDFILWHAWRAEDGPVLWESSLGPGRPAWAIQDPAMITKHLGFSIDLHCGGIDNLWRHHDYTIAIVEAASGHLFCPFWLHGEHLLLDGKKISKSRGNVVYPADFLERGIKAAALRWFMIENHYRSKVNLTDRRMARADQRCRDLQNLALRFSEPLSEKRRTDPVVESCIAGLAGEFEAAMNDDLNIGRALKKLEENLARLAGYRGENRLGRQQQKLINKHLQRIDTVLQVLYE
jgi:cysteinyl-tRNA synthetase